MRNLKRALSLALASVMVLGLMIVGSSAKTSQFADADSISKEYTEAIDVLTTIGVLDQEGTGSGAFEPQGNFTREQAAKIISVMILGKDNAERLGNNTQIFKDVAAGDWSAGYIAYCYNAGIIAGDGAGNFDPKGKLTGVSFGKILLTALGYDADIEGYVNTPSWSINVASAMIEAGIDVDDITLSDPITREQAAQMALNTIKAPMVEYGTRTQVSVNGADIVVGGNEAHYVTTTVAREQNISGRRLTNVGAAADSGFTVEFGERYMKDLRLNELDEDEFRRPCHTWSWKNEEIGTYLTSELLYKEYTSGVTGRDVYDLLGKALLDEAATDKKALEDQEQAGIPAQDRTGLLESYTDGRVNRGYDGVQDNVGIKRNDLVRTNNTNLPDTGNGVLTQIFLDTDYNYENRTQIKIVSVNTYLAKANTDYNETKESAPLGVYFDAGNPRTREVDVETVPEVADVTKGSFYLVNISYAEDPVNGEVVVINEPEILEDHVVTKFSRTNGGTLSKLTTEGTQYNGAVKAWYDIETLNQYDDGRLTDKTYNVYLDPYGYVIGVSLYEGTKNYVFITGYDRNTSHLSITNAEAAGIFLDGTMQTITVNVTGTNKNIDRLDGIVDDQLVGDPYYDLWGGVGTDGETDHNRWYTYTVSESGVYTLKPCDMNVERYAQDRTVNTANLQVVDQRGIRSYGEDDSVYLTVGEDQVDLVNPDNVAIVEVNDVFTGVQNVDIEIKENDRDQVYTCFDNDHYIIGAVVIGEATGANDSYAYITGGIKSEEKIENTYYWEFDAVLKGEKQTLTLKSKYSDYARNITQGRMVKLRFDEDGYVVRVDVPTAGDIYDYNKATNRNDQDTTDNYDVYWIGGDGVRALDLHLQGRTLYITDNQIDNGLAVASDAKAVVIQVENRKTVTTQWDSVAEAYDHLLDRNDQQDGVQFQGTIAAALKGNGSAAWVVFDATQPSIGNAVRNLLDATSNAVKQARLGNDITILEQAKANLTAALAWTTNTNAEKTAINIALSDVNAAIEALGGGQNPPTPPVTDLPSYSIYGPDENGQFWISDAETGETLHGPYNSRLDAGKDIEKLLNGENLNTPSTPDYNPDKLGIDSVNGEFYVVDNSTDPATRVDGPFGSMEEAALKLAELRKSAQGSSRKMAAAAQTVKYVFDYDTWVETETEVTVDVTILIEGMEPFTIQYRIVLDVPSTDFSEAVQAAIKAADDALAADPKVREDLEGAKEKLTAALEGATEAETKALNRKIAEVDEAIANLPKPETATEKAVREALEQAEAALASEKYEDLKAANNALSSALKLKDLTKEQETSLKHAQVDVQAMMGINAEDALELVVNDLIDAYNTYKAKGKYKDDNEKKQEYEDARDALMEASIPYYENKTEVNTLVNADNSRRNILGTSCENLTTILNELIKDAETVGDKNTSLTKYWDIKTAEEALNSSKGTVQERLYKASKKTAKGEDKTYDAGAARIEEALTKNEDALEIIEKMINEFKVTIDPKASPSKKSAAKENMSNLYAEIEELDSTKTADKELLTKLKNLLGESSLADVKNLETTNDLTEILVKSTSPESYYVWKDVKGEIKGYRAGVALEGNIRVTQTSEQTKLATLETVDDVTYTLTVPYGFKINGADDKTEETLEKIDDETVKNAIKDYVTIKTVAEEKKVDGSKATYDLVVPEGSYDYCISITDPGYVKPLGSDDDPNAYAQTATINVIVSSPTASADTRYQTAYKRAGIDVKVDSDAKTVNITVYNKTLEAFLAGGAEKNKPYWQMITNPALVKKGFAVDTIFVGVTFDAPADATSAKGGSKGWGSNEEPTTNELKTELSTDGTKPTWYAEYFAVTDSVPTSSNLVAVPFEEGSRTMLYGVQFNGNGEIVVWTINENFVDAAYPG